MNFNLAPLRLFRLSPLAAAASFLLAVVLTGCSSPTAIGPQAKPFDGITLRIAVPAEAAVRPLVERHGRAWSSGSGASIEIVSADAPADVHLFRPSDAGRIESRLAPIDVAPLKKFEGYQYSRLLGYEVDHDMVWGDKVTALPVLGESLFCVYRADLVEDPRHAAALSQRFRQRFHFPMRVSGPSTWQQVAELAAYFSAEPNWVKGESAKTPRPSLVPLPASLLEFDRDFHAVASSFVRRTLKEEKIESLPAPQRSGLLFSYQIDATTGEPAIASDGFVAALTLLQQLQRYRPAG